MSGGTAVITNSTVTHNTASDGQGGGLYNLGTVRLRSSTVSGNTALRSSGGWGGGILNAGTMSVASSTISGNRAESGAGIFHYYLDLTITNSTVSGNRALDWGAGLYVDTSDEPVTITNSTIARNRADTNGNGGDGGGVFVAVGNPNVSMRNSVLARNVDVGPTSHPDCSGPVTSAGFNIVGTTTGCAIALQPTDSPESPALGSLAANGGATRTHALPAGSIAVGHGPSGPACTGFDQRGAPRSGECDTGAYQRVSCSGLVVNVVGTATADRLAGTPGADGVLALAGNDRVRGGAGADRVCGGNGNDVLLGEAGNDVLRGDDGNDTLNGGPGHDACTGGGGRDTVRSCE